MEQKGSSSPSETKKAPDAVMTVKQMVELMDHGYTRGLAQSLGNVHQEFAQRIWIVDNSLSMQTNDGSRLARASSSQKIMSTTGPVQMVKCTRWEEIQGCVNYHVRLAGLLEAPTTFHLLNDPGANIAPQRFGVAGDKNKNSATASVADDVDQALQVMRDVQPKGGTPLAETLADVAKQVRDMAPTLAAAGQRVVINIATDGIPTNNDDEEDINGGTEEQEQESRRKLVESMKLLRGLPVWVVIRLCTDDEKVVNFYNDLDGLVAGLDIEVLDDYCAEALEVYQNNSWLTYGLPLHRLREMGFHDDVLDVLDERCLTKKELNHLCTLLFGRDAVEDVPGPTEDWEGFCSGIQSLVKKEQLQWDPIEEKMKPWIDLEIIKSMHGDGSFMPDEGADPRKLRLSMFARKKKIKLVRLSLMRLKEGIGYTISVLNLLLMLAYPFMMWRFGFRGVIIDYIGLMSLALLDHCTAPLSKHNIDLMRRTGFSDQYILTCFLVCSWIHWIPIYGPIWLFAGDFSLDVFHFDLSLVVHVVTMLAIVDFYFSNSHKLLHGPSPYLHLLHHCCILPSFTTNLLFHPLDFFIEFGVPLSINGVLNGLIFRDPFAMIVGYCLVTEWYTFDHDQYMRSKHWHHHLCCCSNYFIYLPKKTYDRNDKIRVMLGVPSTEPALKWI